MSQPIVVSTNPNSDTTNVAIDITIIVTMDQAIDPSTVTPTSVTLLQENDFTVLTAQISVNDTQISIKPHQILPKNTLLGIMIRGGSFGIKNLSNEYLNTTYHFKFTTGSSFAVPGPSAPVIPTYPNFVNPPNIDPTSPDASGTQYETAVTPDEFYIISTYPVPQTSNVEPSGLNLRVVFNSPVDLTNASGLVTVKVEPVNGDISIFQPHYMTVALSNIGNALIITTEEP